jgi:pimeloyl-ACP methyl ester carboxylesterase
MNFVYLHGFCSGINSYKGTFFKNKFSEKNIPLHIPDLNNGDFEHLTISSQLRILQNSTTNVEGDITLIGSSLGAYLATLFAQDHPQITRLILMAPAFQFISRQKEKMGDEFFNQWKISGKLEVYHYEFEENRQLHFGIVEDASQYDEKTLDRQIPALILHGLNDESVPYKLSIDYMKRNKMAHLVLLNSDHALIEEINTIWEYSEQFLKF